MARGKAQSTLELIGDRAAVQVMVEHVIRTALEHRIIDWSFLLLKVTEEFTRVEEIAKRYEAHQKVASMLMEALNGGSAEEKEASDSFSASKGIH